METKFDTQLTDAERERLAILSEECAEVIKVIGKITRHGYESCNPHRPSEGTNRHQLIAELGDLQHAMAMMYEADDVNPRAVRRQAKEKAERIKPYLHFQQNTKLTQSANNQDYE